MTTRRKRALLTFLATFIVLVVGGLGILLLSYWYKSATGYAAYLEGYLQRLPSCVSASLKQVALGETNATVMVCGIGLPSDWAPRVESIPLEVDPNWRPVLLLSFDVKGTPGLKLSVDTNDLDQVVAWPYTKDPMDLLDPAWYEFKSQYSSDHAVLTAILDREPPQDIMNAWEISKALPMLSFARYLAFPLFPPKRDHLNEQVAVSLQATLTRGDEPLMLGGERATYFALSRAGPPPDKARHILVVRKIDGKLLGELYLSCSGYDGYIDTEKIRRLCGAVDQVDFAPQAVRCRDTSSTGETEGQ